MLKKRSMLLSLLLAAVMVLAACSGGDGSATEAVGAPGTGGDQNTNVAVDGAPLLTEPAGLADATAAAPDSSTPLATESADGASTAGASFPTPAGTGLSASPAVTADALSTPAVTEAPMSTPAATTAPDSGAMTTAEPLRGAQILPAEGREQLVRLSNWTDFSVVDQNQQVIGQVQDYIINMCEAHILYVVVQPQAGGSAMLIPYEAVSVNGGSIDVENRTIMLALDAAQLSDAPSLNQAPDLTGADWEADVRGFWGGLVSLSSLDTTCSVAAAGAQDTSGAPGNQESVSVTKLAYAGALQGAALQDENGTALGTVQDALVEPESGQLFFLAVERQDGGLTLVPMGAVNVPENAHAQQGALTLVLLVDNAVLQGAPTLDSLDSVTTNINPEAHDYWGQHIPLGPAAP